MEKKCGSCECVKPLEEFYPKTNSKAGYSFKCKECAKRQAAQWHQKHRERSLEIKKSYYARHKGIAVEHQLNSKYCMTTEEYEAMLIRQNHKCVICARTPGRKRLAVDHDHSCCPGQKSCGKCVRGLICESCNHGLGNFKDSIESLQSAIAYLQSWRQQSTEKAA